MADDTVEVIKLDSDIYWTAKTLAVSRKVILDLNGYALEEDGYGIFDIKNGGHLTVIDSRPKGEEHLFGIDSDGRWRINWGENVTVLGGVICGGEARDGGGGMKVREGGRLTMSGGSLVGCGGANGGGVYVDGGVFEMNSCANIKGCVVREGNGDAVYINNGTFIMNGGEIQDCRTRNYGSGVYIENGTFTMTGGEINSCMADEGGALYLYGTMNAGGGTVDGEVVLNKKQMADPPVSEKVRVAAASRCLSRM